MTLVPQSRPRRAEGIVAQKIEDETVLLNPADGRYFTLDEVGGRIWELCDGIRSASEISAIIGEEYDAPPGVIEADVMELLGDLADEKLVVEAG